MKNDTYSEIVSSTLYIVPTPIGNLNDITYRALSVLRKVNLIAAEDTRHTGLLLEHFSINTPLFVFHEYNEKRKTSILLSKLQLGYTVALVSDAGTPLINDPGYYLVRSCYSCGIRVVPLPGACAAITALTGSGLPANRFCFEGFLPSKRGSRISHLKTLFKETRTLIFYDSKYRVVDTLEDMIIVLGPNRYVALARELTKVWEFIYRSSLQQLFNWVKNKKIYMRGEIVLVVEGYSMNQDEVKDKLSLEVRNIIDLLAKELPHRKVVDLVVNICRVNKNIVYDYLLNENF